MCAGIDIKAFPKLAAWAKRCYARPAVKKGVRVPGDQGMMIKLMESEEEVAKALQGAAEILKEAGADDAVSGENAAFQKK